MKLALYIGAIGLGILEIVITPLMDFPAASLTFAAVFIAMTVWFARRGSRTPVIVLAVLFLLELVFLPGYDRTGVSDWVFQSLTAVLGVIGLVGAVGTLLRQRRALPQAA